MKHIFVKLVALFFLSLSLFFFQKTVFSAQPTEINFFYSSTCPHCARAKVFLNQLKKDNPQIVINQYEVSTENKRLIEFYQKKKIPLQSQGLVPVIFIDEKYFIGYNEEIAQQIKNCFIKPAKEMGNIDENCEEENIVKLPIIGKVEVGKIALPIVAIVLGVMDGFNICSLGALLLILALVLAIKSRIKTLIFGGSFILTTAIIYGLLIFFWYQLFNMISPYLRQTEILIGILTVFGGVYFLKEFIKFRKQGPICEIGPTQKIEGNFSKTFQSLLDNKASTITIIIMILFFAIVITVVEFPCSAAVPVAFAGMLTKASLPDWQYVFYIGLYVLFYMFDELLVFLIAFFTMKLWIASPKFITWLTLLESIIMFSLGAYYLFGLF